MKINVIFLSLLSAVASVSAHGVIAEVIFPNPNGSGTTTRKVPLPGQGGANNSPIRSVSSQDPNYGTDNPAITCGPDSKAGTQVAEVAPGAEMSFVWKDASGGPWPHNIGPIITYMASCGNQNCNEINDPADLKWFKTEQLGRKRNSPNWFQDDIKNGDPSTATIPKNLAPGNYMIRHEIIALHIATTIRKAEFYPGCVAVRVTGSGTGVPKASDLVSFPGAYKDNDPGIFTPNIFDANVEYEFPGPEIADLAPANGGANARSLATTGGANANLEERSNQDGDALKPRRFSRIMKRLLNAEQRSSGSAEPKPIEKRSTTPPSTDKGSDTIMVPRRYSRIMKRLVDDLAKNGQLPPL
ncbi:hypothetical protein CVT24_004342 [Panaeolus cyanescens]|uniref:lytic cellulose monooxygenase (C4-dehydrogenating) n=1 Tax=Panaeolus cyanescens TaxID=181874 RepID=A0A409WVX5_9AGAR|nr:hypothetical protein CVT24_004342 [Panaeolus cyanescens]